MLTPEQEAALLTKVGKEATEATVKEIARAEKEITAAAQKLAKEDFEAFKAETLEPINKQLAVLEEVTKTQGNTMAAIVEKASPNSISLEDFIVREFAQIKGTGKIVEFSAQALKDAGVQGIITKDPTTQTIAATIPVASPYAPGLNNGQLSIYDIVRNPNFIASRVNLGRTDKAFLAWANEGGVSGKPARVVEGGLKPKVSRTFTIQLSEAKKLAAYSVFTEEFLDDLPGFATFTRRKLEEDIYRAFDDAIQEGVQNAATPFNSTDLYNEIQSANYWDALYAMIAQVGNNNFNPNAAAIKWLTNVVLKTQKNANDSYLLPSFKDEIERMMVYANKIEYRKALVGDLKQYNVDVYKDIYIKMGLINDQLIHNEETIVVEMRYHDYISDARKKAIVYDGLERVKDLIDGTPGSF